jgi:hypothetical protein
MKEIAYTMYRDVVAEGYDGKTCCIAPKAFRTPDGRLHIDYTTLFLSGSDVFGDRYVLTSEDGGRSFSAPRLFNGLPEKNEDGVRTVSALNAYYHKATNSCFALGRETRYTDGHSPILSGRNIMRALTGAFDAEAMTFTSCEFVSPPGTEEWDALTFMEPLEDDDGTVLIPAYGRPGSRRQAEVAVFRFAVENGRLRWLESSPSITRHDLARGLCEPRLTKLGGTYYLTMRSDEIGWFARSEDGMRFTVPTEWRWDDGEILTSRNTQQGWLRFPDGLFLVYTRETPHNAHIFRRRAPLFLARFDEERDCLVRDTERIAVPEMGARLGNFCVTEISDGEAWICVCEWMQTTGPNPFDHTVCARYGANNRLWRIRIVR